MDKKSKEIWELYKKRGSTYTNALRTMPVGPKLAEDIKKNLDKYIEPVPKAKPGFDRKKALKKM